MRNKYTILLEPDPPDSSGGTTPEPKPAWMSALGSGDTPPSGEPATPPPQPPPAAPPPAEPPSGEPATPSPPQGPPPPAQPALSKEDLQNIVSSAVAAVSKPPDQQRTLTEADYAKMFNIFTPTKEDLSVLGIEATPERVTHFSNMLQSVVKQAVTMAATQQALEMKSLQERLTPMNQFYQQQQADQMKGRFFQQYPDLKGTDALLEKIKDSLVKEGKQFDDEASAFKFVAETARAIIKQVRGGVAPQVPPPQGGGSQQTRPNPPNNMPRLSGGGQGGAGDAGGSAGADAPNWRKALG